MLEVEPTPRPYKVERVGASYRVQPQCQEGTGWRPGDGWFPCLTIRFNRTRKILLT